MQVIAILRGMSKELYNKLVNLGIDAHWVGEPSKKEIVIYLQSVGSPPTYKIPEQISRLPYSLVINCMEHGEEGKGVVVCGTDGSMLKHYRLESQDPPEKLRAYFNVSDQVATVTVNGGEEPKIVIREYRIQYQGKSVYLVSSQRWVGRRIEHLPGKFKFYRAAVKAAIQKKSCKPCKCAHFSHGQRSQLAPGLHVN